MAKITPVQVRSLVQELRFHMPHGAKSSHEKKKFCYYDPFISSSTWYVTRSAGIFHFRSFLKTSISSPIATRGPNSHHSVPGGATPSPCGPLLLLMVSIHYLEKIFPDVMLWFRTSDDSLINS